MGVRVSFNVTQPKSSDPPTQPNFPMNNDWSVKTEKGLISLLMTKRLGDSEYIIVIAFEF